MDLSSIVGLGSVVGLLIGLTGMDGGSILTPALIYFGSVPAAIALGTDLLFSFVTKLFGAWYFHQRKRVDLGIVVYLAVGSLPGAAAGIIVLRHVENRVGAQ